MKNRAIKCIKSIGSIIELIIMIPFALIGASIALIILGYEAGYNFINEQMQNIIG